MGQRGKQSAASLAVLKPSGVTAIERPKAPDNLTIEQAHEWRCIVNRMPADWFPRETHGLLSSYCRHVVSSQMIAGLIEDLLRGDRQSENWLDDYEKLLKMQDRETRGLSALATRMRTSQQGTYNQNKKTGSNVKKPWEN